MKDQYAAVMRGVLKLPSLQVTHYRQPRLTAIQLANVLSWAYNGLHLHHLDSQVKDKA